MEAVDQEQLGVAIDFHIQAKRQVLERMAILVNGMLIPQMVAQVTVQGLHVQCIIANAPVEESLAVLQKINELAVKAGLLPREVVEQMGDVKGCWRRPVMPPVVKKDRRKLLRFPAQQITIPRIEREEFIEPMRNLDREMTRKKMGMGIPRERKKRRKRMGEASEIVGKHDHSPVNKKNKGYGSILERMTGILDDLDTAICAKEKDLNREAGKESENALKLGKLKASEAMIRQARALLEDYGSALDQDAEVVQFPLDPSAWVKAGALAEHDTGLYVVDEVQGKGVDRVVKVHREGHERMKAEYPIDDFMAEFDSSDVIDGDFPTVDEGSDEG